MNFDEVWNEAHRDLVGLDLFGVAITISRPGGDSFQTTGVRQEGEEYVEEGDVVISTQVRSVNVHLPDCEFEPEAGDTLTLDDSGQLFHVYAVRPEGAGVARLELHEGEA